MTRSLLLTLLLSLPALAQSGAPTFGPPPTAADWEAAKCAKQADGRVSCGAGAFRALTDSLIEAQAEAEKLQLQLAGKDAQLEALKAALLAVPTPAPAPAAGKTKAVVAVVSAVLGTMAVTTAALTDTLSPGARIGLGITGAAAVAGSFAITF